MKLRINPAEDSSEKYEFDDTDSERSKPEEEDSLTSLESPFPKQIDSRTSTLKNL